MVLADGESLSKKTSRSPAPCLLTIGFKGSHYQSVHRQGFPWSFCVRRPSVKNPHNTNGHPRLGPGSRKLGGCSMPKMPVM